MEVLVVVVLVVLVALVVVEVVVRDVCISASVEVQSAVREGGRCVYCTEGHSIHSGKAPEREAPSHRQGRNFQLRVLEIRALF